MSRFTFRVVLAVSIVVLGTTAAAGVVAATQPSGDEQALQPTRQPADRRIESRVNALLAQMTLEEKLQQIQLLPDFLVTDDGVRKGLGSVLSVTDPQRISELQTHGRRGVAAEDPDPLRLRHHPRVPHDLPDPAGQPARASIRRSRSTTHTYGARESAVVGLKQTYAPDGRRLARAALGPHRRGRGRGSVPELRARGRARQGDAGQRLQRARQARREPEALRRLRPARGRPRLQHDRHVRAAAAGTCICRRSRPPSTPARTPPCARSTPSTACRAAATTS